MRGIFYTINPHEDTVFQIHSQKQTNRRTAYQEALIYTTQACAKVTLKDIVPEVLSNKCSAVYILV